MQEGSQRQVSGSRAQGADPGLHSGRASAIEDEQQPGEERVVPPPLLLLRLLAGRSALCDGRGDVAVEAGVGGEFRGQALRAHGGPVHLYEGP